MGFHVFPLFLSLSFVTPHSSQNSLFLYDWVCGEVNVIPNELYIACMGNLVPQQKPRRDNLAPALFEPPSSFLTLTTVIDCVHNYFIPVQAPPSNQYTPKRERTPQKTNSKSNENISLQHSRCIETCHEFKIAHRNPNTADCGMHSHLLLFLRVRCTVALRARQAAT